MEFVALQSSALESLLIDEATRRGFVSLSNRVRTTYKALMPDPSALAATQRVAVIRTLANKIAAEGEKPDISAVTDSVSDLLDRSVGTKEYIIRSAGDAESLIDLNQLDFDLLARQFAGRPRTQARQAEDNVGRRITEAVRKNPTRSELADRFRKLIADYNAGTHNLEEFLRRLRVLNDDLTEEEDRSVREGLSEPELAIYDLLTKPAPELNAAGDMQVREASQKLLGEIEERLVLDWKKRQHTRSAIRVTVGTVLDNALPGLYGPQLFDEKCEAIYDHIYGSFFDDGNSVYADDSLAGSEPGAVATVTAIEQVDDDLLARARADESFRLQLMADLFGVTETWGMPTADLIRNDEVRSVEFKETARWNVREQKKDKLMEEVVAKTIAGFLNGAGGTLFIGVHDERYPVGLDHDIELVKPPTLDGYVNWLDTMLENSLGHAGAHRLLIRVDIVDELPVCRVDCPASSKPIWATLRGNRQLFQRRNNSTRAVPEDEVEAFIAERFVG